jgi:hypothetical protein
VGRSLLVSQRTFIQISKVIVNIDDCARGLDDKTVIVVENDSSDGPRGNFRSDGICF